MGTKAIIICKDAQGEFAIYKHWDGNPSSVAELLDEARRYAWPLPRYEADDFAAAVVRAAKPVGGGDVRLCNTPDADVGQEYTYVVTQERNKQGGLYLNVMVYAGTRRDQPIFCGATGGFRQWAAVKGDAA